MSVVIVGGHDRMVSQYKKICKDFKCKAKVFTQMSANLSGQIGSPDLLILFTNTVSHKMVHCAVTEAEKCNANIVRCHTSSQNALTEILNTLSIVEGSFYNTTLNLKLIVCLSKLTDNACRCGCLALADCNCGWTL